MAVTRQRVMRPVRVQEFRERLQDATEARRLARFSAAMKEGRVDLLLACAWCGDYCVRDGDSLELWVAPEELPPAGDVGVSHGICPACHSELRRP